MIKRNEKDAKGKWKGGRDVWGEKEKEKREEKNTRFSEMLINSLEKKDRWRYKKEMIMKTIDVKEEKDEKFAERMKKGRERWKWEGHDRKQNTT